ncbi:hypothetical protein ACIOK4_05060 [Streptomyces bottropensis]
MAELVGQPLSRAGFVRADQGLERGIGVLQQQPPAGPQGIGWHA